VNLLHILGYAVALYLASGIGAFFSNGVISFFEGAKRPLLPDTVFILKRIDDMTELMLWIVVIVHALRHSTPNPYINIVGAMVLVAVGSFVLEKKFRKSSDLVFWIRVPVSFAACFLVSFYVAQHVAQPNPSIERTSPGKPGAASHVKR